MCSVNGVHSERHRTPHYCIATHDLRLSTVLTPDYSFFFFNDTATTEIYPLSLHDALPISGKIGQSPSGGPQELVYTITTKGRSEEHTSELQSQSNLVCRLLLEKKKKKKHHSMLSHNILPCQTTHRCSSVLVTSSYIPTHTL